MAMLAWPQVRVTEGQQAVSSHYKEDVSWQPLLQRFKYADLNTGVHPHLVTPSHQGRQQVEGRPTLAEMAGLPGMGRVSGAW